MAAALSLVLYVLLGILGLFLPPVLGQYRHIGCFKDKRDRAIKSFVKTYRSGEQSWRHGDEAVRLCQLKTLNAGFVTFGVQNGGECWTSSSASATYNKYGTSSDCVYGNKGGPYANAVYAIKDNHYSHSKIGCFKDTAARAIPSLEGYDAILDGRYERRKNAITKCAQAARTRGYQVFAIQNGGWCASSATAHVTYNKYGASTACRGDGEGGPWANEVYVTTVNSKSYRFLGCYRDNEDRAMPKKVGDFRSLNNKDVVDLCYLDALKGGYTAFGVQLEGQCFTGPAAHLTYMRYGRSNGCRNGKGGSWTNDVYLINDPYVRLGCFADSAQNRAMPTQTGSYLVTRNSDAVRLCYLDTLVRGWYVFGVQNNGVCWSSPTALQTYSKHGKSTACAGGKGAFLANDVYALNAGRSYIGCTYGWQKYEESCYRVFTAPKNWYDAKDSCKAQGAYLVKVTTQWEQDFTERFLRTTSNASIWIGLNDLKRKGDYRWVNNEQVRYFNWDKDHKLYSKHDCVTMVGPSGKWLSQPCSKKFQYVCRKEVQHPKPARHENEEETNIGAIIGGVIGGWVVFFVCCCNKRNHQGQNARPNPQPAPPPTNNTVHTTPPPANNTVNEARATAPSTANTDVEGANVNEGNDNDSTRSDSRDFDPPPPFQDSWSIPEQPPPSYDEAIRMENTSIVILPGGRGGDVSTS